MGETQDAPSLDPDEKGDRFGQDGEINNPKVNLRKNFNSKGHKMQRRLSVDFSEDVETIPLPSLADLSLVDINNGEDKEANEKIDLADDTIERDVKIKKKFTYHQDSMKRYKKQLSKNSDLQTERKISEELSENQTCVLQC